ncbi:hypothetical protein KUTeg_016241 [Tegillarca granosa]|uniref:Uncharacterized protein n=1 Tax=Tegillarca granosa TaxID=220873 RepID=A0ABQ9EP51_TEGGR|nr:hypothetical protein KUTeg_016241 [Tegillarca granosa]
MNYYRSATTWLFWTDWENQKIERCGMDGTGRQSIINEDYDLKKLYWTDAKMHRIGSANYDGSDVRIVLQDPQKIPHPYGLTIFEVVKTSCIGQIGETKP